MYLAVSMAAPVSARIRWMSSPRGPMMTDVIPASILIVSLHVALYWNTKEKRNRDIAVSCRARGGFPDSICRGPMAMDGMPASMLIVSLHVALY